MSKQVCINHLPLCDDVNHIIKSFCFYDTQSAKTRKIKQIIVDRFRMAKASRFRPNGLYLDEYGEEEDSNTCEHWYSSLAIVCNHNNMYNTCIVSEKTFQAVNCSICGGYQHRNVAVPEKIMCSGHTADLV